MPPVSYNLSKLPPRFMRLAKDHMMLDELCNRSNTITYEILERKGDLPPSAYLIHFKVRSIIGIDASQNPIYGDQHTVSLKLPPEYPGAEGDPICYMTTNLWHPNVRSSGSYKGRICINAKALGAWHSLDWLVIRIGEMIQYKNYLAENIPPYPEDETVAKWVREFAEPHNIVNLRKAIYTDDSDLMLPLDDRFERLPPPPPPKPVIKISIRPQQPPGNGSISIRNRKL